MDRRKEIISISRIFLYKKNFKISDDIESNQAYYSQIVSRLYPSTRIKDDLIYE